MHACITSVFNIPGMKVIYAVSRIYQMYFGKTKVGGGLSLRRTGQNSQIRIPQAVYIQLG